MKYVPFPKNNLLTSYLLSILDVNGIVSNSYFAGNPKIHSKFQKVVVELPTYSNNAKAFYHSDNNSISK